MGRIRKQQIDETFVLELGQTLVRKVKLDDETTYAHRCPLDSFKQIAHAIEEAGEVGTTIELVAKGEDMPTSQVAVARAFLVERGLIDAAPARRFRFVDGVSFEDAIVEFHALR